MKGNSEPREGTESFMRDLRAHKEMVELLAEVAALRRTISDVGDSDPTVGGLLGELDALMGKERTK